MNIKQNIGLDKAFSFALESIKLYQIMILNKEYVLSRQFLKSSTSIGANINEAQAAYSKKDFAFKMSIASKEARETDYWLTLIELSDLVKYDFSNLKSEINNIKYMLTAIVKSSQLNKG